MPAFVVWRRCAVAVGVWSAPPPLIPEHRDALPEDAVQPVVQLKVAAPHDDVVHDILHIGRQAGTLRACPRITVTTSASGRYFPGRLSPSRPADPIDTSARPDRIMYQKRITPGMAMNVVNR